VRRSWLLVLGIVCAAAAQDQPPRPTFRTEANYVRVDVYPTLNGAPVMDLTQDDFEVLEEKVPQRIEQFEHVVIRSAGPQDTRIEPNTVRESRTMMENPRARVFVVFLDTHHVDVGGSHNIRKPLVEALDRMIGPDDLVGVMTPYMSAADIAFARKTTTIEGFLARYWTWGERDQINSTDPVEDDYRMCYPGVGPSPACSDDDRGVADEMIERRREKLTLDALSDLARYLRGVREERKAILAISDGWRLFREDPTLARKLYCQAPSLPPIGIDPRSGKPTADPVVPGQRSNMVCERDRQMLAYMDDEQHFRNLLDEANAANVSFYPIDPRGLVVFDEPISKPTTGLPPPGSTTIIPPTVDAARLRARLTSLRTLAEATDGLAIVNSNDLSKGLRRVVDDLSSYYLLGYYSSGRLDGKFHAISVRVKRQGVQVRARRGYLAATPNAVTAAAATAAAGARPAKANAEATAIATAISPLAGYGREMPIRLQAAAGWKGDPPVATVWVEGELGAAAEFNEQWKGGASLTFELAASDGPSIASARATVAAGARSFRATLVPDHSIAPGEYIVRVAARGVDATIPTRDTLHLALPPSPRATGAIWLRRGQSTGNRDVATADLRFRRSEQLRVEVPTLANQAGAARLLDRTGKALAVPVTAAVRTDSDGSRWLTAQLALSPLAVGDYVIELSEGSERILAAFRVIP
jgi:VWFA-related protein